MACAKPRHGTRLRCLTLAIAALLPVGCGGPSEPDDAATPARVRLITQEQYFNSVTAIFGADLRIPAQFAPLRRTDGLLGSGAASAGVPIGEMQRFQQAAASISRLVVDRAHRDFLVPCEPTNPAGADDGCARAFLQEAGRLLYRRPLDEPRLAGAVSDAGKAAERLQDFYGGLSIALEGMLMSPRFLFIADRPVPGSAPQALDAYSLASRLSFFLWNAGPDDALLRAAEDGSLLTEAGRRAQVDRMLASPRLEAGVRAFFDDLLGFEEISTLAKDPTIYPAFTPTTAYDAREQTLRTLVDHLLVRQEDYRDLFTTRRSFLSPALAPIYRVPAVAGWTAYEFPEGSRRVGLLAQVSFLALHSHPGRSSATLRGKALRELLLCQRVPAPPPNVDFSIVEDPNANFHTARERLTAHRNNAVCAGCHKVTDPIGLALENFDGAGQFRENEGGVAIDVTGDFDGEPFGDLAGLGRALRNHPSLPGCFVNRIYSYAIGGTAGADASLAYLEKLFARDGYRLPALLRAIALSQSLRRIQATAKEVSP